MYKQLKMHGDMVRLVKQYFPEHLDATHLQLAKVAGIHRHIAFAILTELKCRSKYDVYCVVSYL